MTFIDGLREAIEKKNYKVAAQETLLLQLAKGNANAECKQALLPLQNPALVDMIEACIRSGKHKWSSLQHKLLQLCRPPKAAFDAGKRGISREPALTSLVAF